MKNMHFSKKTDNDITSSPLSIGKHENFPNYMYFKISFFFAKWIGIGNEFK